MFNLSSANIFNLDQSNTLSFHKELNQNGSLVHLFFIFITIMTNIHVLQSIIFLFVAFFKYIITLIWAISVQNMTMYINTDSKHAIDIVVKDFTIFFFFFSFFKTLFIIFSTLYLICQYWSLPIQQQIKI